MTPLLQAGDISALLLQGGLPGIVILVLGWVAWKLYEAEQAARAEVMRVQDARVSDAQKVATSALEREEKWQSVLGDLTAAVQRLLERTTPDPGASRRKPDA